jgi:hypothetical protein
MAEHTFQYDKKYRGSFSDVDPITNRTKSNPAIRLALVLAMAKKHGTKTFF